VKSLIAAAALLACASACYQGPARPFDPGRLARERGWIAVPVPEVRQAGEHDCGAAAATMVLRYWKLAATPAAIRAASGVSSDHGIPAGQLRDYLRARGLDAYLIEGSFADLERELVAGRPVLVGVARRFSSGVYAHYQVVAAVSPSRRQVAVLDPADGWLEASYDGFLKEWKPTRQLTVVSIPREAAGGGEMLGR
jgi:ABC-type bacteriocin/lantibiotic exporter with double-glycine peptidase domain